VKFLIDNAVSPFLAESLVARGYDAIHVRDLGMAAVPDEDIFALATQEDRIIVSADTAFGTLLAFQQTSKSSFILFRQTDKRPVSNAAAGARNIGRSVARSMFFPAHRMAIVMLKKLLSAALFTKSLNQKNPASRRNGLLW